VEQAGEKSDSYRVLVLSKNVAPHHTDHRVLGPLHGPKNRVINFQFKKAYGSSSVALLQTHDLRFWGSNPAGAGTRRKEGFKVLEGQWG